MTMFMYSSGMRNATKNADGIAEITLNDPRMQGMVEKTVALLRNRSVTMFVADFGGDVTYSLFVPTFIDNRLLFHFNWVHMSFELRDMQADFGIFPFPKYDEGQDRYYCYDATGYQQFVLVPATNSVLDVTGCVLDSMGYHAMELITPAFIETSVTDKMLRDEDSAKVLAILNANRVYELYDLFRWGNIGNIIGDLANANSTDFTSKFAAAEAAAKKELADTYEKYGN
ncbi:MAG: hypothetical protein J6P36_03235 [Lachnospiraceae bacterium]|nr:hypothetical protein [Lachnospiraceae bacterium]